MAEIRMPMPSRARAAVAVPAPGAGPGFWAGAPSATRDEDGTIVLAYRVRSPEQRGTAIVVAYTTDGEHLTTVTTLQKDLFGADSLERPALVHLDRGRWRLYVSCATPRSKHWRIVALDADDPSEFGSSQPRRVFAGSEQVGVKDPVVRRVGAAWQAWVCCHPLDQPGEEDRMTTAFATSNDGLAWRWHGTALSGRAGMWDARGARVTAVLADGWATYDGRATKQENFSEATGVARLVSDTGRLRATNEGSAAKVRYLEIVPLGGGRYRLFFEAPLTDGSHQLCTEEVSTESSLG